MPSEAVPAATLAHTPANPSLAALSLASNFWFIQLEIVLPGDSSTCFALSTWIEL